MNGNLQRRDRFAVREQLLRYLAGIALITFGLWVLALSIDQFVMVMVVLKSGRASRRRSLISRVFVALDEPAVFTSSCALSGRTRTPCLGS